MTRNTIFYVRHGENPANLTREFSHRLVDYSLTETGRRQAERTAAHFQRQRIDAIYSSPLKRARETAEIIARRLTMPVSIVEQFREVNVGSLDGQASPELWKLHDSIFEDWLVRGNMDSRFPEGETLTELIARMHDGLQTVLAGRDGQRILVVAHGGILVASMRALCPDVTLADMEPLHVANCAITEMEIETGDNLHVGTLRGWARCTHLA